MSGELTKDDRLAWETGVEDDSPQVLWRVYSTRNFADRPIRHTNWFVSEQAAKEHADWIVSRGGTVHSVGMYRLTFSEGFCEHGVADGDFCEPCNKEYKRAAKEASDKP